ncbi:MAG: butyrate kinase [candidate division WOR-3 bacterium]|nr:butyrate kinase [candidate division WOR-3 bacterium]
MRILVINPGGSSTKIAIFYFLKKANSIKSVDEKNLIKVFEQIIHHPVSILKKFKNILDQYNYRKELIIKAIGKQSFDIIVTRGGPLKPLKSGTYPITPKVISDIKQGRIQSMHPSLLGPIISYAIAKDRRLKAFFVDPESVDEFSPLARISGLPEIERKALSHFLNIKAVVRKVAKKIGKPIGLLNFIVAHLGSGITVSAIKQGKLIDANNANEDGPFSPQRTGSLPLAQVIEMCFSGKYSKQEMLDKIQRKGGLLAYLGTDDIRIIEQRIKKNDKKAKLIYEAMIYQIAKEIGSMYVVLKGKVSAIVITGGLAKSQQLVRKLKQWISFIKKPVFVIPGEEEMKALALGVLRVILGIEKIQKY